MLDKDTMRAYMQERRESWRQQGLCPQCGSIRENTRFKICQKCRNQSKARMKRYNEKKNENEGWFLET